MVPTSEGERSLSLEVDQFRGRKQDSITISTTQIEYQALGDIVVFKDGVWLNRFRSELSCFRNRPLNQEDTSTAVTVLCKMKAPLGWPKIQSFIEELSIWRSKFTLLEDYKKTGHIDTTHVKSDIAYLFNIN